ncbi:uncharacterized protein LOC119104912 [Pollicipes pollicipes]|uniref:uncharacterized protein LOC119104912 n=1 Tax=Pollicipes pollicipes TaxID=41117 RepID=UPI001885990C|nr:uncharacterized protein LOC119104912 [Pollicipes pollicipes]
MSIRSWSSSGSGGGGRRESQRGKRGNFVGKLTQSVRRIVKEVKEDPIEGGQSREEVIVLNERLRKVSGLLDSSFCLAKEALLGLHNKYDGAQEGGNVFTRYKQMKLMIKEVIRLETQYWALVEVPRQEKTEPLPAYVLRACSMLERTKAPRDGAGEETDEEQLELIDRLDGLTITQIHQENQKLTTDLYRQLKKYSALRALIKGLSDAYAASKIYPAIPRYMLLTTMIRDVLHSPEYMELYRLVPPASPSPQAAS